MEMDLDALRESWDFEAKTATGRDGRGQVPANLWETYSAMANTEGGIILLGAREGRDGCLHPVGIPDIERVEHHFWTQINDHDKVSHNLLQPKDVEHIHIGDHALLLIHIPRADRRQRPVFLNGNPLKGTFLRRHDSDQRASQDEIRRMLADAQETPRDGEILSDCSMEDLDSDSLTAYRNLFSSHSPGHPFLAGDNREMLRQLGGWRQHHTSQQSGPTLAGLLMFGKQRSILDRLPHFHLDYQHLPDSTQPTSLRWLDRITLDGLWPGNLFEFYRKVIPKLRDGLRLPFQLDGNLMRIDDTPQHQALREAVVNTLIHADYSGHGGIRIRRSTNSYEFINPGTLRLPKEQILQGGRSDCRNPALQTLFQMIGAGEKAGSGFPRILLAWREQHWRIPILEENHQLYETRLTLTSLSLFPEDVNEALHQRFAPQLVKLGHDGRLAIATALQEGRITNKRMQELTDLHPSDLTGLLRQLVTEGILESHGVKRGTWYSLPEPKPTTPPTTEHEINNTDGDSSATLPDGSSAYLDPSSAYLPDNSSAYLDPSSAYLDPRSAYLDPSSAYLPEELLKQADMIRSQGRTERREIQRLILAACQGQFLSLRTLSTLLGRAPAYVRFYYLREMIAQGELEMQHPDKPNHPNQSYRTASSGQENPP
ncbi:MAG: hypothetical protein G8345_06965 [Magnetococcales bacterium]|nr:putative DNA binding domain-containing protein [Magnetococcales bacterium]NGZ26613.1 hypothetical protein [Magnetococcales bacterium]